jgi:hypothetical protein
MTEQKETSSLIPCGVIFSLSVASVGLKHIKSYNKINFSSHL